MIEKSKKALLYEGVELKINQILIDKGFVTDLEVPLVDDNVVINSGGLLGLRKEKPGNFLDLKIDKKNNELAFCNYQKGLYQIYEFKKLLRCEVTEDSQITQEVGLSRQLLGAALAGAAGVLIASNTTQRKRLIKSITLHVYTNNLELAYYPIGGSLEQPVERTGIVKAVIQGIYRIYASLEAIISQNQP